MNCEHPQISVRRAGMNDWPAIHAFITQAYEELAPYKGWDRWNWQFCQNPYLDSHDEKETVPVWIALDGEKVVGQIAVQTGMICIRGRQHQAGWIVDVMVLPEYRGMSLGHKIHAVCAESVPILVTLTMAAATRRIAERAGSVNLTPATQFARIQNPSPRDILQYLLDRTKNRRQLHQIAGFLVNYCGLHWLVYIVSRIYLRLRLLWKTSQGRESGFSIREAPEFGPEFDDLWSRTRHEYEALFVRDSKFLSWRFENAPDLIYRKFIAERHGVPVGYAILRLAGQGEPRVGTIVDLFASRNDTATISEIVRFCLEEFGSGVSAVDCVTSIGEIRDVLRSYGFWPIRTVRPTCVCQNESMADELAGAEWFFSKADHDWDQIHLSTDSSSNAGSR